MDSSSSKDVRLAWKAKSGKPSSVYSVEYKDYFLLNQDLQRPFALICMQVSISFYDHLLFLEFI